MKFLHYLITLGIFLTSLQAACKYALLRSLGEEDSDTSSIGLDLTPPRGDVRGLADVTILSPNGYFTNEVTYATAQWNAGGPSYTSFIKSNLIYPVLGIAEGAEATSIVDKDKGIAAYINDSLRRNTGLKKSISEAAEIVQKALTDTSFSAVSFNSNEINISNKGETRSLTFTLDGRIIETKQSLVNIITPTKKLYVLTASRDFWSVLDTARKPRKQTTEGYAATFIAERIRSEKNPSAKLTRILEDLCKHASDLAEDRAPRSISLMLICIEPPRKSLFGWKM